MPPRKDCQTFLLNQYDTIIAIGNPVTNPQIHQLYKRCMENLNYDASTSHLDIQSSISRSIGVCHQRDTISVLFQLDNPQNQIKTIENIVPACDCTSAYIDKDTIPPFGYALVNMIYVVDTVPGAFKKSADIFMHESDIPIQITICGYIK